MPEQFWGLTMYEFELKAKAHSKKTREEWERAAQQTVWIVNSFRQKGQRALKLNDLIKDPNEKKAKEKTTPKKSMNFITDLKKQFGY